MHLITKHSIKERTGLSKPYRGRGEWGPLNWRIKTAAISTGETALGIHFNVSFMVTTVKI